jgi:hypothetical protein
VDEAHNVAPPGQGKYAIDSQRTAAIRALAPHFEHKLFLTATPHNGYPESFTALLELLDNQRFARGVMPDPAQLGAVMVRRLKAELPPRWDGSPRFPGRTLYPIEVDYSAEERQAHAWLRQYTQLRQQHVADALERYAGEFVLKLLKKRLFSSPAAFASTLAQHEHSLLARPRSWPQCHDLAYVKSKRNGSAGPCRAISVQRVLAQASKCQAAASSAGGGSTGPARGPKGSNSGVAGSCSASIAWTAASQAGACAANERHQRRTVRADGSPAMVHWAVTCLQFHSCSKWATTTP